MKILHLADTHIGPFPGPVVGGKNVRADDTLRCFDELIEKATTLQPDLIIHAGDLFHAAKTWSERGISEVDDAIQRITELADIAPVVIVRGTPNHDGDAHYQMLKTHFDSAVLSGNVTIITEPGRYGIVCNNRSAINLCALPGFDKGYWRSKNPGLDREQETKAFSDALEKMIVGMKAQCEAGYPSVLVGHYTVEGANTESGQTMMFSQFEPIITHRTLTTAGYDLCCFGHIHKPQALGANAFYSGSINRLNFNDEGDRRGFYMHTLEGNKLVSSEFIELESPRKFKTVRLDDAAIHDFNLTGMLPQQDVEDAIVRVVYDCTDENQKAMSRAQMEKAIMDMGAMWVQEITPRNITVTVNRKELSSENDPVQNLREYLTASATALSDDDIAELMDMGRKIIDRVLAEGHTDKASGLFAPVEISVTNYRNYREETFSFDDVHFATINGQNGVGKSSLFMDALYDALYEEPREGDLTGWICNDPDVRSGSITFVFRVGDKLWRVARTRVKSGKATLNLSEMVDGEWVDRSCEKMRDTQSAIERVIGIDGQTLRACALIMQDQYGLFLQAGKEERMQILSDILGLSIYDQMADEAAEKATEGNRSVRALQARKDELTQQCGDMEALNTRFAALAAAIAGHDARLEALDAELNALNADLGKLRTSAEVYAMYRRQIDELRDDITRLQAQKRSAEADRNRYATMLADQSDIAAGAEKYRKAVTERDALQDKVNTFTVMQEKRASIEAAIRSAEDNRRQNDTRIHEIDARIYALKEAVGRREQYEREKQEHDQIAAAIAAAEEVNTQWNAANSAVADASLKLTSYRATARADFRERAAEIEGARKRVAMLQESNCPIVATATCRFLADAIAARDSLPELEKNHAEATEAARVEIEHLDATVKAAEAARDALQKVDDAMLVQMRARQRELASASVMLAQIEGYVAELAQLEKSRDEAEKRDSILVLEIETRRSELARVDADIAGYNETYDAYCTAVNTIQLYKPCVEKEQQLIGAKDRMDAAQERVDECQRKIDQTNEHIADREKLLEGETNTAQKIYDLNIAITAKSDEIGTVKGDRDRAVGSKATVEGEIKRANALMEQIGMIAAQIDDAARVAAFYEILKQAFGPNGIPHNVTRSIIPVFEATASTILGQMSQGRMSVELVTEKVLKSNNKKEVTTLDVIINDADTGRLPYLSRSGGERVKAALSVILALSEVMKNKLGVQLGFLEIDEAPFLDQTGIQAYCDALETIQRRYPDMKVLAITHDESFKARFPQSITVTKDERGSHATLE